MNPFYNRSSFQHQRLDKKSTISSRNQSTPRRSAYFPDLIMPSTPFKANKGKKLMSNNQHSLLNYVEDLDLGPNGNVIETMPPRPRVRQNEQRVSQNVSTNSSSPGPSNLGPASSGSAGPSTSVPVRGPSTSVPVRGPSTSASSGSPTPATSSPARTTVGPNAQNGATKAMAGGSASPDRKSNSDNVTAPSTSFTFDLSQSGVLHDHTPPKGVSFQHSVRFLKPDTSHLHDATTSTNIRRLQGSSEPQPGTSRAARMRSDASYGVHGSAYRPTPPLPAGAGVWMSQLQRVTPHEMTRKQFGLLGHDEEKAFDRKWEAHKHALNLSNKITPPNKKPQQLSDQQIRDKTFESMKDSSWRKFDQVLLGQNPKDKDHPNFPLCRYCHCFVRGMELAKHEDQCPKQSLLNIFNIPFDPSKTRTNTSSQDTAATPPANEKPPNTRRVHFPEDKKLVETRHYETSKTHLRKLHDDK